MMGRVLQPDTLLTQLRDLERRLRALESTARTGSAPLPFAPARPADWWTTTSAAWERLAVTVVPRRPGTIRIRLRGVTDAGTTGQVRVVVDGATLEAPLIVDDGGAESLYVTAPDATSAEDVEIAIDACRTAGTGAVRVIVVWARTALT
jgi:hypothetical protein